jgi:hypothetical protein
MVGSMILTDGDGKSHPDSENSDVLRLEYVDSYNVHDGTKSVIKMPEVC